MIDNVSSDIPRKFNLQRSFNFEVLMPDVMGESGILISGDEVSKYIKGISVGGYDIVQLSEMRYGPYKRRYASYFDIGPVVIRFYKPTDDIVSTYLRQWRSLVVDSEGFYYEKNHYSKSIWVYLNDRDGTVKEKIGLSGAFPLDAPKLDGLDYDSENIIVLDIRFNVDRPIYDQ